MFILIVLGLLYFGSRDLMDISIGAFVGALGGYAITAPLYHRYVPLVQRKP